MNPRFRCTECDRLTESFEATIEGPHGAFDAIIPYCHFCNIGFYMLPNSDIELVEIEKPVDLFQEVTSSQISNLGGSINGFI